MGFFSGLASLLDYMMYGEDSASAARTREQTAEYERQYQERLEREEAKKAEVRPTRSTAARNKAKAKRPRPKGWSERMGGGIDGHPVTVKFGTGVNEGHTLIDDGDLDSADEVFDNRKGRRGDHNHYGPKREAGGGHFSEDRGHYTSPGH